MKNKSKNGFVAKVPDTRTPRRAARHGQYVSIPSERGQSRWTFGNKSKKNEKGFTLIEIMIVLGIVAVLFSFVGVSIMNKFKESQLKAAKIQIASLEQALQAYFLDNSMYPSTAQGLKALIEKPTVGKIPKTYTQGGYLAKQKVPDDPWGEPYQYECENHQDYKLFSMGPDREAGTEDDITNE